MDMSENEFVSVNHYKNQLIEAWNDEEYRDCFKNTRNYNLNDSAQ